MELLPGTRIDRYSLERRLGAGGQGEVWRASDRLQPGRSVALKLVPLTLMDGGRAERVRREARLLSRLKHPALPTCHALFEDLDHNLLVIALELVEGTTLHDATPRLDEAQRVSVLRHLAATLAHLHERGVVHRDLKPENVILEPGFAEDPRRPGVVRLIDLGISVERGNAGALTQVGHIVGTAPYLAPEILDPSGFPGDDAAPAVDVFALGVLGWGLMQGSHPTGLPDGASMTDYALAYRHADQLASWPAHGRGDRLEPALRRCLAVRARERFASGADVFASFERALGEYVSGTSLQHAVAAAHAPVEPRPAGVAPTLPHHEPLPPDTVIDGRSSWSSAPPTVHATPLPVSLHDAARPSIPSAAPSSFQPGSTYPAAPPYAPQPYAPTPAPAPYAPTPAPAFTPAPVPVPRPAAPAPAPIVGFTPKRRGGALAAPAKPAAPLVAPSQESWVTAPRRPSLLRYLMAFFLLLVGGAAAFVLTLVIFVLVHLGR